MLARAKPGRATTRYRFEEVDGGPGNSGTNSAGHLPSAI